MPLPSTDPDNYQALLAEKLAQFRLAFAPFAIPEPEVFPSAPEHYRLRAEFRVWHQDDELHYAMFDPENPKQPVMVDDFPMAAESICGLMPRLMARLRASQTLRGGLFQADFLATLSGELMVTLIYHRPLGIGWELAARDLAADLGVQIIGRSRGQKVVLDRDWLLEEFELNGRHLRYQQVEGSFTQPNGGVNRQMLGWACAQAASLGGDLLELYCGNGNFTMALAPLFGRALATEVSKSSVHAAQYNMVANEVGNLALVRASSAEIADALAGRTVLKRMKEIDLAGYRFSTLFVDPPRSGLDATTLEFATGFDNILYISCNPQTLQENVAALQATHRVSAAAVFDQFPYTHHLESGLLLTRR
ncbi:MAG TPA: tRNA (uridine(54)-C5)-methyltransferase TrmA [Azonexus sp.]|jgi:tRNA (uracil-5-)-methyltransferase|nr:tRNA (uridine(54)-C5)-methyltransferase TrmA [Azonexus sp.]